MDSVELMRRLHEDGKLAKPIDPETALKLLKTPPPKGLRVGHDDDTGGGDKRKRQRRKSVIDSGILVLYGNDDEEESVGSSSDDDSLNGEGETGRRGGGGRSPLNNNRRQQHQQQQTHRRSIAAAASQSIGRSAMLSLVAPPDDEGHENASSRIALATKKDRIKREKQKRRVKRLMEHPEKMTAVDLVDTLDSFALSLPEDLQTHVAKTEELLEHFFINLFQDTVQDKFGEALIYVHQQLQFPSSSASSASGGGGRKGGAGAKYLPPLGSGGVNATQASTIMRGGAGGASSMGGLPARSLRQGTNSSSTASGGLPRGTSIRGLRSDLMETSLAMQRGTIGTNPVSSTDDMVPYVTTASDLGLPPAIREHVEKEIHTVIAHELKRFSQLVLADSHKVTTHIMNLSDKMSAAEQELQETKSIRSDLEAKLAEANAEMDAVQLEKDAVDAELDQKRQMAKLLEDQIHRRTEALDEARSEFQKRVMRYKGKIIGLEDELKAAGVRSRDTAASLMKSFNLLSEDPAQKKGGATTSTSASSSAFVPPNEEDVSQAIADVLKKEEEEHGVKMEDLKAQHLRAMKALEKEYKSKIDEKDREIKRLRGATPKP